jgi:hypothetical protein
MNREALAQIDENMVCFDGLDEVIIGHGYSWQSQNDLAVYDYHKIILILMKEHEMTEDEALDFFSYNILGLYAGDQTPFIVVTDRPEELDL